MSDGLNIDPLKKLIKALKAKPVIARVGILGNSASRTGGTVNNAFIGSCHEFGTSKLPVRSFLRLPLSTLLDKQLKKSGALDKDVLAKVVKDATFVPFMEKVAVIAEDIVLGAFDSAGYGTWVASDMKYKKNHQTLVETQQLRNSITSEVRE